MKKYLFNFLLSGAIFAIPNFSYSQQYDLKGDATQSGFCYQLTGVTQTFRVGSVSSKEKITLDNDFKIEGTLNFGNLDEFGADGIVFMLQSGCDYLLGPSGGALGYAGLSSTLTIEFDTFFNSDLNDPNDDHVALMKNGDIDHATSNNLQGPVTIANLEDGLDHSYTIEWTSATNTLKVELDGVVVINYSNDIVSNVFGGNSNVYWGFTGATGFYVNNQSVCLTNVSSVDFNCQIATPPAQPGGMPGTIYLGYGPQSVDLVASATGLSTGYSYDWDNGDVGSTISVSPTATTTYTVTVTDLDGCTTTCSVTVNVVDVRCGKNNDKVMICHNGNSICISPNAVPAHLSNHGDDYLGSCMNKNVISSQSIFNSYPNPSMGMVNLEFEVLGEAELVLEVFNTMGQLVYTESMTEEEGHFIHSVNLSNMPNGIYMIKMTNNGIAEMQRIQIQK